MAKHRVHSIEFKQQVARDFIAGETLHALASRHDISRNLIGIWGGRHQPALSRLAVSRAQSSACFAMKAFIRSASAFRRVSRNWR
jgi:transposase-like protein